VVVKILLQMVAGHGLVRGTRFEVFVEEGGASCNVTLRGCLDVFACGGMLGPTMLKELDS